MHHANLRRLFLTVQEREPARFTWVLMETTSGAAPAEIAVSRPSLDNYSQAVREGAEALAMLGNLSRDGPRTATIGRGS